MRRGNTLLFLLVILLLGGGAFYIDFQSLFHWPTIDVAGYKNTLEVRQGLDLKGGVQFVFEASCPRAQPNCDIDAVMPQVVQNINRRITQGLAVSEPSVRASGHRILVELPGFTNAAQASALLGQTGEMNILDTSTANPPVQPGGAVTSRTVICFPSISGRGFWTSVLICAVDTYSSFFFSWA